MNPRAILLSRVLPISAATAAAMSREDAIEHLERQIKIQSAREKARHGTFDVMTLASLKLALDSERKAAREAA